MAITIWIANQTVAWTTALAIQTGSVAAGSAVAALDQGGCPITYVYTQLFTRENLFAAALIAIGYALCLAVSVRVSKKRRAELLAAEDDFDSFEYGDSSEENVSTLQTAAD